MPGWRFDDDAVPKRLIALRHLSLGDEGSFNALALKRDPRPNLADGIYAAAFEADVVFAFVAQKVDPDVAAEVGRKVYFAGRRLAVITPDALPCFGQVRACFTEAFPMGKAVMAAVAGIVDDYRRQDETFRRELAEEEEKEKAKAQGLQSEETGAKPDSVSSSAPTSASAPREGNQAAGAKMPPKPPVPKPWMIGDANRRSDRPFIEPSQFVSHPAGEIAAMKALWDRVFPECLTFFNAFRKRERLFRKKGSWNVSILVDASIVWRDPERMADNARLRVLAWTLRECIARLPDSRVSIAVTPSPVGLGALTTASASTSPYRAAENLRGIVPGGQTDAGRSLSAAARSLAKAKEDNRVIVMLTSGRHTHRTFTEATVSKMKARGVRTAVFAWFDQPPLDRGDIFVGFKNREDFPEALDCFLRALGCGETVSLAMCPTR